MRQKSRELGAAEGRPERPVGLLHGDHRLARPDPAAGSLALRWLGAMGEAALARFAAQKPATGLSPDAVGGTAGAGLLARPDPRGGVPVRWRALLPLGRFGVGGGAFAALPALSSWAAPPSGGRAN